MSARLLLLALGSTLLTACPGKATHITDATRGFIKQRESERHDQFKGAEPVDINTLAAVVITAVGATQTASRSYPIPGCDSGRALCVRTSRGGATQRVSSSFGVFLFEDSGLCEVSRARPFHDGGQSIVRCIQKVIAFKYGILHGI